MQARAMKKKRTGRPRCGIPDFPIRANNGDPLSDEQEANLKKAQKRWRNNKSARVCRDKKILKMNGLEFLLKKEHAKNILLQGQLDVMIKLVNHYKQLLKNINHPI